MIEIAAAPTTLTFDPALGQLVTFTVTDGATITPLHTAPWVGTGAPMPPGAAPHLATLGGDFFCAPFGGHEGASPLHGFPPNSPWTVVAQTPNTLTARLDRPVFGATLTKTLALCDNHPFVYQTHTFAGGEGAIAVANHANVALPRGGLIRVSPKARWQTPQHPQESDPARGRSALTYPATTQNPAVFPGMSGPVDLTRYPWAPRHEDFVIAIEAGDGLGWTAVTRAEGNLFLSLRNAAMLPMTMLWHSNGGRDYAPWSSRHYGCLGVEEGVAGALLPPGDAMAGAALTLGGTVSVRHVIGALPWPADEPVAEVTTTADTLHVTGANGHQCARPFNGAFFATP
ncbi:MAG: hypothetical protein AAF318_06810 [Pseudomonadota bacterium]